MSLPVRHIVIDDRQQLLLRKDVWSDTFVEAFLRTERGLEPIQLRYRGGHTRDYPKKSYEIVHKGITYHLNAEYDDPSMIRNALSFRFFRWIGVPSPETKHVLIRWNNEHQGVYLEIEAVDRRFFRKRGIPMKSLLYAVNDRANFSLKDPDSMRRKSSLFSGYRLMAGPVSERKRLTAFITNLHTRRAARLSAYLQSRLDIDNYLRWLAGAVFTGNYDGFDQNYALFRKPGSERYGIIPWDYEGTWGRNCYGKSCGSDLVRISGYNDLTAKLLSDRAVRLRYKKILQQGLKEAFTLNRLLPEIRRLHDSIYPHMYADRSRKWPFALFETEPEFIQRYIQERRTIIRQEIKKW
ncbi:CotH kinase family protein [Paenibacillus chartarius]|uniref:CotH kinase family protein n=1 Tax=Paenibacillus chartarius TaxID=747481 RepID=A0ABV6DRP5_9BACL